MAGVEASAATMSSIHASAVLVGPRAVLIRGRSGSGKSRLALSLLQAAEAGHLAFARLVSDDRTRVSAVHGRLIARPVPELAGLLEVRGSGIVRVPYEPAAVAFLVIDLESEAPRLPDADDRTVTVEGIALPRLAVASVQDPLPPILAEIGLLTARPA
jgi:serine kinase of HPr protein (carbohydrate metabolism regulator)